MWFMHIYDEGGGGRTLTMESRGNPATEAKLVEAAVKLFSQKWYGIVSVAEICREAGLSNGVFYRYFDGKETLFRRILGSVLDLIRANVDSVSGSDARDRLRAFARSIVEVSERHPDLIAVFREGQYRLFEYEQRLVAIYTRALGTALGREAGLPEYLFALGGIRFCAIRRSLHGSSVDLDSLFSILEGGLFRGLEFDTSMVFGGSASPLPLALEESARERLLRSGKRLFGEKGFFETNIHEVTDGAGLSVGAFYTYFESKESFYSELIAQVGHEVRTFIARNIEREGARELNRLERELRGLWLWLVYLSMDKNCYTIVREAEFVLPAAVREYYGAFISGYRKNPEGNSFPLGTIDEGTAIEFLLGLAHYFGIELAFDESPANARAVVETIGGYLSKGFSDYL